MTVRDVVAEELTAVLSEAHKPVSDFASDKALLENGLGLDSLEFAVLVVRLELRLHVDPFSSGALEEFPRSFDELVMLYERQSARAAG